MGIKTWSVAVREEYRSRVCEDRVLKRVFGPKRQEGRGKWRKLRNEKLNTKKVLH
jgi:hypothetical protein